MYYIFMMVFGFVILVVVSGLLQIPSGIFVCAFMYPYLITWLLLGFGKLMLLDDPFGFETMEDNEDA